MVPIFGTPDYILLFLYFLGIATIGIWAGRKQEDTETFYLGKRTMPWFAVCLSILATETSGVTFLGAPGDAFQASFFFLQMAIGSIIARFLIAYLFLPSFYKYRVTTIYEYLKIRFGQNTQATAAILYYATRLLASGVRVLAASIAVSVVTGWHLWLSIVVTVSVTTLYTIIGGMKAIIWTDVAQILIFFGGPLFALVFLVHKVGGWSEVFRIAGPGAEGGNHFQIFNRHLSLTDPYSIVVMIIAGLLMTFAAMGCDYDMTQRMLTCKNKKESQRALIWTGFIDVPIVTMFLAIGACLFAFYQKFPDPTLPENTDFLFAHFIVTQLPVGLKGLLIAGVFAASMSSLSGSLGALSTSAITDIYRPYIIKNRPDRHYLFAARCGIFTISVLFVLVTLVLKQFESQILWLGFRIVAFTYGALLGVFLLGVTVKRGSDLTNLFSMLSSVVILIIIWLVGQKTAKLQLAWTWYPLVGLVWTYFIGFFLAPRPKEEVPDRLLGVATEKTIEKEQ